MSEFAANLIASKGSEFGAQCQHLIAIADTASAHGGNGLNAKEENDLFEEILERTLEAMWAKSSEEACDLFEANAKLEYYGALASKQDRKAWRETSWEAWQAVAQMENAA